MKKTFFTICTAIVALAVISCGPGEARVDAMPSGERIEKAYNEVIKKAAKSKIELCELSVVFRKTRHEGSNSSASIEVTINDPENEGSLLIYDYDFVYQKILSINRGTLNVHTGRGGSKRVTAYDDYKYILFDIADLPPFSKFDSMYKAAVEESGFDASTAYPIRINAEFDDKTEALAFCIRVQRAVDKSNDEDLYDVYFDKGGSITHSVLVSKMYD